MRQYFFCLQWRAGSKRIKLCFISLKRHSYLVGNTSAETVVDNVINTVNNPADTVWYSVDIPEIGSEAATDSPAVAARSTSVALLDQESAEPTNTYCFWWKSDNRSDYSSRHDIQWYPKRCCTNYYNNWDLTESSFWCLARPFSKT